MKFILIILFISLNIIIVNSTKDKNRNDDIQGSTSKQTEIKQTKEEEIESRRQDLIKWQDGDKIFNFIYVDSDTNKYCCECGYCTNTNRKKSIRAHLRRCKKAEEEGYKPKKIDPEEKEEKLIKWQKINEIFNIIKVDKDKNIYRCECGKEIAKERIDYFYRHFNTCKKAKGYKPKEPDVEGKQNLINKWKSEHAIFNLINFNGNEYYCTVCKTTNTNSNMILKCNIIKHLISCEGVKNTKYKKELQELGITNKTEQQTNVHLDQQQYTFNQNYEMFMRQQPYLFYDPSNWNAIQQIQFNEDTNTAIYNSLQEYGQQGGIHIGDDDVDTTLRLGGERGKQIQRSDPKGKGKAPLTFPTPEPDDSE
ncbi:hypothetical protein Mgra_00000595 [Meloidogyne graminicola]|uniref:BED-type domain-containing protein n=1 Tax=Meloidogyne graminicola TaxID=189291 RepID=A0A8T0A225_9BILA|nr:hypothetical protein Mgra_00000595 [Meloidogyne graminicola]